MRDHRAGRSGARGPARFAALALALTALLPAQAARAHYVERGYGGPPVAYDEPDNGRGYRPAPRRVERRPVGYNCDAIQQGITGPKPFSCPLPGPRPLGVRCFCDLPIASFSPPQTAIGHVVP